MLVCVAVVSFPTNAQAAAIISEEKLIYQQDFSQATGWFGFGVSGNTVSLSDGTLCMDNHTRSWYSPAYDLYDILEESGAGTYWLEVKVKYTGTTESAVEQAHVKIRGNNTNSFLVASGTNYYQRISRLYDMSSGLWCTMQASFKILESDFEEGKSTQLRFCIDGIPAGNDVNIYLDDFVLYKMADTQITNGDFNNELVGWRGWCSDSQDYVNYISTEETARGQYVCARNYGSIACNVDQILDYYGAGKYTLQLEMYESHLDYARCGVFEVYLTQGTAGYSYKIGELDLNKASSFEFEFTINDAYYTVLSPEDHEVFLRFCYKGDTNYVYAYYIDNVKFIPTLCIVNYYDSTVAGDSDQIAAITAANDFANYVYYKSFGIRFVMDGEATFYQNAIADQCTQGADNPCMSPDCGTCYVHHKNIFNIHKQIYNDKREDNHVYVMWADRKYGSYCYENNSYEAIACVFNHSPVVQFMTIQENISNNEDFEENQIILMSTTLVHELAHTLGFEDVYENPEHLEFNETCVMGYYNTETQGNLYNSVMNEDKEAFCNSCKESITQLIYQNMQYGTFYSGNIEE